MIHTCDAAEEYSSAYHSFVPMTYFLPMQPITYDWICRAGEYSPAGHRVKNQPGDVWLGSTPWPEI